MIVLYSICEMKKTGLALSALAQGVGPEIDLVSLVIQPVDLVAMFFELDIVEAIRFRTKKSEHLALCQQRSQVNDAGKSIIPYDLDHAVDDRLGTLHEDYVSH
jgi:hypothetical protein